MSVKAEIGVKDFKPGMAVKAVFITPSNGRPTMNLMDDDGNIVLHFNLRWDDKALVLNTKKGGWGSEERPDGVRFRDGKKMKICAKAKDDCFKIEVDGDEIHEYKHRMPCDCITKVTFQWDGSDEETKLKKLMICY